MHDTDLLIIASLQSATRFFSAGNSRMRLAAHLHLVKYREQRDIKQLNKRRGFNGKPSKR
jgi:hypothetical protein